MTARVHSVTGRIAQLDSHPVPPQWNGEMMERETLAAYLVMQDMAESTIRNYVQMHARWADWAIMHDRHPDEPDPLTVRAWATSLPGSRSLRGHARAMIGHLCRALEIEDVSAAIPLPREHRQQGRTLTPEQTGQLVRTALDAGLPGLAVLVGLYTGARRSEIASLGWPRIDLAARTLTLLRDKTRDRHTVPLHPLLHEQLERRRVPGEHWVFPGKYGGHTAPAMVWEWVIAVGDRAGVGRVTPHVLRRTCLTEINDGTGDLRAAQTVAGHTNPAVTARYTRASERAMQGAIAALSWADDGT